MKKKVFVTRKIPEAGTELLRKYFDVTVSKYDRVLTKQEVVKNVKGKDAMLCLLTDHIDKDVMKAGKKLKIIANYAVGYDNVDVKAAKELNIMITNTPGVLTETVAEHTVSLMMSIARRIPEADKFVRAKKYRGWEPLLFLGSDIKGKTLGVVGLGRIGYAVTERAATGLGMNVLYYDVRRNKEFEKKYKAKYTSIKDIFKKSDFVTIHVPLLPSTKHLVNMKLLKSMKKTAYLINTSRGPVIDERALVKVLKNKLIAGAAIDVFEYEPKLTKDLEKLDNIVLTPHIASGTFETRSLMAKMAAQSIVDALSGKKPKNLIKVK